MSKRSSSIGQTAKEDNAGYSKTAVIEARVDVRDLANFARFLIESGNTPTSRSDLVWKAFRSITETLQMAGQKTFETTEEAHSYMISLGIGSMNRPGRGGRPMNAFTLARKVEKEGLCGTPRLLGEATSVEELIKIGSLFKSDPNIKQYADDRIVADTSIENAAQRVAEANERDRLAQEAEMENLRLFKESMGVATIKA